jgi:hypothetical protein
MAVKRNYKKEYRNYHSKPAAKKKRAGANRARKKLGLKVGDPRDAGHVKRGGGEGKGNIKAQSRSSNRAHGGRIGNRAGKARGGRKSKR